jgi:predicted RecB family nuclease
MLYYEMALDASAPAAGSAARDWLLTYNRNDVEATTALRNWLEASASACPSIASSGN